MYAAGGMHVGGGAEPENEPGAYIVFDFYLCYLKPRMCVVGGMRAVQTLAGVRSVSSTEVQENVVTTPHTLNTLVRGGVYPVAQVPLDQAIEHQQTSVRLS